MVKDLKQYKLKYGLSNDKLAKLLGISKTHFSLIMNNKRKPSTTLIDRIIIVTNGKIDINSFHKKTIENLKKLNNQR